MKDSTEKDLRVLKGTLIYIEDIEETLNRCGRQYEVFYHDRVFFNAIGMALMQVGELGTGSNGLSVEFKEENSDKVDWNKLKKLRNMFAHSYDSMNERFIFRMATMFIPVYKEFCIQAIAELQKRRGK